MTLQAQLKDTVLNPGEMQITKNPRELIKANRVASSIIVAIFDPQTALCGMIHLALPDSSMVATASDEPLKYVDTGLPIFLKEVIQKGLNKQSAIVKLIGGSQLFNFGGGGGNILNIGTRNAITARTLLTREGLIVAKAETGGNKARNIVFEIQTGNIQVSHPGETFKYV